MLFTCQVRCHVHMLPKRRHVFGGVVNLSFIIKCTLGIKCIFPCSFRNKCMCLLTHVYGTLGSTPLYLDFDIRPQHPYSTSQPLQLLWLQILTDAYSTSFLLPCPANPTSLMNFFLSNLKTFWKRTHKSRLPE